HAIDRGLEPARAHLEHVEREVLEQQPRALELLGELVARANELRELLALPAQQSEPAFAVGRLTGLLERRDARLERGETRGIDLRVEPRERGGEREDAIVERVGAPLRIG